MGMELNPESTNKMIRLAAVGDIMLGDHPVRLGHGVKTATAAHGPAYLFEHVRPILKENDIVFGNLEAVLSDAGLVRGRLESEEFRGSPICIPALRDAGFTILSFSNNHCLEHGEEAFWNTVYELQKHDIFVAGIKGPDGRCIPYRTTKSGLDILLLSYSLCREDYYKGTAIPYTLQSPGGVLEEVRFFREESDILIVSLHWGYEHVKYPAPSQVAFAHQLVDEGVNVILGHHPHILQGVEKYKRSVVVYSLGNFIFDMWQRSTRESMIFRVNIAQNVITGLEAVPVYISNRFQPQPVHGDKRKVWNVQIERVNRRVTGGCSASDRSQPGSLEDSEA